MNRVMIGLFQSKTGKLARIPNQFSCKISMEIQTSETKCNNKMWNFIILFGNRLESVIFPLKSENHR